MFWFDRSYGSTEEIKEVTNYDIQIKRAGSNGLALFLRSDKESSNAYQFAQGVTVAALYKQTAMSCDSMFFQP